MDVFVLVHTFALSLPSGTCRCVVGPGKLHFKALEICCGSKDKLWSAVLYFVFMSILNLKFVYYWQTSCTLVSIEIETCSWLVDRNE